MRQIAPVIVGLTVLALCGCGGTTRHSSVTANAAAVSEQWATSSELRWLRRVGLFTTRLGAEIGANPVKALGACRARLRRDVGQPPTSRLHPVVASLRAVCDAAARYVLRRGHDPRLLEKTASLIGRVRDEGAIGARRRLPSVRGIVDTVRGGGAASHTDPLFDAAASAIADKTVTVRCWSPRDWQRLSAEISALAGGSDYANSAGFAVAHGDAVNLSPSVCSDLDVTVIKHDALATGQFGRYLGFAVLALAHEAEHARGIVSERKAQCYAMQMLVSTAERLRLTAAEARHLTDVVWNDYKERRLGYWSRRCRPGGTYDLHLHDPAWP